MPTPICTVYFRFSVIEPSAFCAFHYKDTIRNGIQTQNTEAGVFRFVCPFCRKVFGKVRIGWHFEWIFDCVLESNFHIIVCSTTQESCDWKSFSCAYMNDSHIPIIMRCVNTETQYLLKYTCLRLVYRIHFFHMHITKWLRCQAGQSVLFSCNAFNMIRLSKLWFQRTNNSHSFRWLYEGTDINSEMKYTVNDNFSSPTEQAIRNITSLIHCQYWLSQKGKITCRQVLGIELISHLIEF